MLGVADVDIPAKVTRLMPVTHQLFYARISPILTGKML